MSIKSKPFLLFFLNELNFLLGWVLDIPSKVSRGDECPAKDLSGLLTLGVNRCPCQPLIKMIMIVENIAKVANIIWLKILEKLYRHINYVLSM